MKAPYIILLIIWIVACSEPFEFDAKAGEVYVIDAKVSTLTGRSFARFYSQNNNGGLQELGDLNVCVVNSSGVEFPFFLDDDSLFRPVSAGFKGEVGMGYKLAAYRQGQLFFESDYDVISPPIDFNISIGDTTVVTINTGSLFNEVGTAVYVNLSPQTPHYSKFEFRYFYEDFYTEDTIEVNDIEEYTLYSCLNNACPDSINVPVGVTLKDEWYFIRSGCVLPPEITNVLDSCKPSGNVCCEYRADWPVQMEVISEALSPEVFDFWTKVERLSQNDGLVFDTYPFSLIGNMECVNCDQEVVGLFRAVAESSKKKELML